MLLRSGRGRAEYADDPVEPLTPAPRRPADTTEFFAERIELGLLQVGRRLDTVMTVLAPYRTTDDELHTAYAEAHDALGDLAATYTWVTLGRRPAPPARRGPRRRPSGG
jgi:hypothetical protein